MLGRQPLKNTKKTDIKLVCEGVLVDICIMDWLVRLQDILEELGACPEWVLPRSLQKEHHSNMLVSDFQPPEG